MNEKDNDKLDADSASMKDNDLQPITSGIGRLVSELLLTIVLVGTTSWTTILIMWFLLDCLVKTVWLCVTTIEDDDGKKLTYTAALQEKTRAKRLEMSRQLLDEGKRKHESMTIVILLIAAWACQIGKDMLVWLGWIH